MIDHPQRQNVNKIFMSITPCRENAGRLAIFSDLIPGYERARLNTVYWDLNSDSDVEGYNAGIVEDASRRIS